MTFSKRGDIKKGIKTVPTLVLGLGGTGKKVLVELKSMCLSSEVSCDNLKLLAIDTDPSYEIARSGDKDIVLEEVISMDNLDYLSFVETQYDSHPEINSWLSLEIVDRISMGTFYKINTEGDRQIGRLALFMSLNDEEKKLGESLKIVLDDLTEKVQKGMYLNVVIITSSGGGTGSAIFVDMAYIIREILKGIGKNINIIGIVFLPEPFRYRANLGDLHANTWASLKEVDYFMSTVPRLKKYRTIEYYDPDESTRFKILEVNSRPRPFDQVYLVSDHLESGRVIVGMDSVVKNVVKFIITVLNDSVNTKLISSSSYVKAMKNYDLRTIYSGFGVASVYIPIDDIEKWISVKFLLEYLSKLHSRKNRESTKISGLYDLDPDYLVDEIQLSIRKDIEDHEINNVIKALEESISNAGTLTEKVREKLYQLILKLSGKELLKSFKERVSLTLNDLLIEPFLLPEDFGLDDIYDVLESYLSTVDEWLEKSIEDLKTLKIEIEGIEKKIEEETTRLQEFEEGEGKYKKLVTGIIGYLKELKEKAIRQVIFEKLKEFYHSIRLSVYNDLESIRILKKMIRGYLEENLAKIEDIEKNFRYDDNITTISVFRGKTGLQNSFRKKILEEVYSHYKRDIGKDFFANFKDEKSRMESTLKNNLSRVIPAERILDAVSRSIENASHVVRNFTIDKWLEMYPEDAKGVLKTAFEFSSFMIRTKSAEIRALNSMPEEEIFINVEDRFSTLLKGSDFFDIFPELKKAEFVSTGNPYELSIVKIYHGVRIDDIVFSEDYIDSYKTRMKRFEPLHVFPEFNINRNGLGKKMVRLLAEALKTGVVSTRNGSVRVMVSDLKELEGKNLFDILWLLVNDEGIREKLEELVKSNRSNQRQDDIKLEKILSSTDDFLTDLLMEEIKERS